MRSTHDKHFAKLWAQQLAGRRWKTGGNIDFNVPVQQPFIRGTSEARRVAGTPASNRAHLSEPEGRGLAANGTGVLTSTSGGVESRHADDTRQSSDESRTRDHESRNRDSLASVWGRSPRALSSKVLAGVAPGPLTLMLPFPPTLNHSSMPDGHGGRYLTEDHRAFRTAVGWIVKQRRLARIDGRLAILISLYPADNRRWDIDNRAKAVLDALQYAGLFRDDSAVDDLHIVRMIPGNEAWCTVTINPLGKW